MYKFYTEINKISLNSDDFLIRFKIFPFKKEKIY